MASGLLVRTVCPLLTALLGHVPSSSTAQESSPAQLGQAIKTGELSGLAVQMAVMVMALLPVAVLSPFVQKHFKKGMLTGAVKG